MPVVARIIDRVAPENRQKLYTPLEASSVSMLVALNQGLLKPAITDAQAAPLVAAGYARQVMGGGYVLTDVGAVRAMMEQRL